MNLQMIKLRKKQVRKNKGGSWIKRFYANKIKPKVPILITQDMLREIETRIEKELKRYELSGVGGAGQSLYFQFLNKNVGNKESSSGMDIQEDITFADVVSRVESSFNQYLVKEDGWKNVFKGTKLLQVLEGLKDSKRKDILETTVSSLAVKLGVSSWWSDEDGDDYSIVMTKQHAVRSRHEYDPHLQGAVDNMKRYTLGKGVKLDAEIPDVKQMLGLIWKKNSMQIKHKDYFELFLLNGEQFLVLIPQGRGQSFDMKIRRIRTEEIVEIETHPEDSETVLAFVRQVNVGDGKVRKYAYPVWNYEEITKDKVDGAYSKYDPKNPNYSSVGVSDVVFKEKYYVVHFKIGNKSRGRSPFVAVLPLLKYYGDYLTDIARLHHFRTRVMLIENRKDMADSGQVYPMPRGGVRLIEGSGVTYRFESPNIAAGDSDIVGRIIRLSISSGLTLPEFILFQDASHQVYASIKKSDNPFVVMVEDYQDLLSEYYQVLAGIIVREAVVAGALKQSYKVVDFEGDILEQVLFRINEAIVWGSEDLDKVVEEVRPVLEQNKVERDIQTVDSTMDFIFPLAREEDPDKMAKVLQIHNDLGLASIPTLSAKAGYDWRRELAKSMQYQKYLNNMQKLQKEEQWDNYNHGESDEFPLDLLNNPPKDYF